MKDRHPGEGGESGGSLQPSVSSPAFQIISFRRFAFEGKVAEATVAIDCVGLFELDVLESQDMALRTTPRRILGSVPRSGRDRGLGEAPGLLQTTFSLDADLLAEIHAALVARLVAEDCE